jgi:hypothetical protein
MRLFYDKIRERVFSINKIQLIEMFFSAFIQLRNAYTSISKAYTTIIRFHPGLSIAFYLISYTILSFGLFQLKFDLNKIDDIIGIRNSYHLKNVENFHKDQQNQSLLLPYQQIDPFYVEFIVKPSSVQRINDNTNANSTSNLLSTENLNEYNQLFDLVKKLKITNIPKENYNFHNEYTYEHDLCLAKSINHSCNIVGNLNELLVENFGRSSEYKLDFISNFSIVDNRLTSVGAVRTRFNLKSTTLYDQYLAKIFMIKFVNVLKNLKLSKQLNFDNVDFTFYASHTLVYELEAYTFKDFNQKFIISVTSFVLLIFVLILIKNYRSEKEFQNIDNEDVNDNIKRRNFKSLLKRFKNICVKNDSCCVTGGSYLPFAIIIQNVLTVSATFGVVSLFHMSIKPLFLTIVIVLISIIK